MRRDKHPERRLPAIEGTVINGEATDLQKTFEQVSLWFEKKSIDNLDLEAMAEQFREDPKLSALIPTGAIFQLFAAIRDNDESRACQIMKAFYSSLERNMTAIREELLAAYEQIEGYAREVGGQGLREKLERDKSVVTDGVTKMVYQRTEQMLDLDRDLESLVIDNRTTRRRAEEKRKNFESFRDSTLRLSYDKLVDVLSRVSADGGNSEDLQKAKTAFCDFLKRAKSLLQEFDASVEEAVKLHTKFNDLESRHTVVTRRITELERMFKEAELETPFDYLGIKREDIMNRASTARFAGEFYAEVPTSELRDYRAIMVEVDAVLARSNQGAKSMFNDEPSREEEIKRLVLMTYVALYPSEQRYRKSSRVVARDVLETELGWIIADEIPMVKEAATLLAEEELLSVKIDDRWFNDPQYRGTEQGSVKVQTWKHLLRGSWDGFVSLLKEALQTQREKAALKQKNFTVLRGGRE